MVGFYVAVVQPVTESGDNMEKHRTYLFASDVAINGDQGRLGKE